jgi:tetratricopeptide (TPR) repeat protein
LLFFVVVALGARAQVPEAHGRIVKCISGCDTPSLPSSRSRGSDEDTARGRTPSPEAQANHEGVAASEAGDFNTAMGSFLRATQLNPNYTLGHINLGLTYWKLDHREWAISQFKIALRAGNAKRWGYSNKELSRWIADLQSSIYFDSGRNYDRAKDWVSAEAAYRNCIALEPAYDDSLGCYWHLGIDRARQGDQQEAVRIFRQLLAYETSTKKLAQENAEGIAQLKGLIEIEQKVIAQKREEAGLAVLHADFDHALELLKAENYQAAEAAFREYIGKSPDPGAYFNLSVALQGQGRWKEALAAMQTANDRLSANAPEAVSEIEKYRRELQFLKTHAQVDQLAADFSKVTRDASAHAPDNLQFLSADAVDLREAKTLAVDPAKLRGSEPAKPQASPEFAQPSESLPANTAVDLHQLFQDPQYEENQTKALLAMAVDDKKLLAEAEEFLANWDQHTLMAIEKHRSKELLALRENSAEMAAAYDQIQKKEAAAVIAARAAALKMMEGEWEKLRKQRGYLPGDNLYEKAKTDPQLSQAIDELTRKWLAQEEQAVLAVEAQTQKQLLEAAHQIITLGKPWSDNH